MNRSSIEWEQDIVECLSNTSHDNPMPVRDIAEIIGINESEPSCSRTRGLILKAINDISAPIGSNRNGYYLINTKHEMQRYLNDLLNRQIAISKRIEAVYKAFNNR
jgi:hypothetical protein